MCAIIRDVVVFPLVPVMAAMGMRDSFDGGKSMSITGLATLRGVPSVGETCMRNPGAALISQMAPPISRYDLVMSGVIKSTPATSRPIALAAPVHLSIVGMNSVGHIDSRTAPLTGFRWGEDRNFTFFQNGLQAVVRSL